MICPFVKPKAKSVHTGSQAASQAGSEAVDDDDGEDEEAKFNDDGDKDDNNKGGDESEQDSGNDQDDVDGEGHDMSDGDVDENREAQDEREIEEIAVEVEPELAMDNTANWDGKVAIHKITHLAKKIHYSQPLCKVIHQLCKQKKCPIKILPHHVSTWWNSLTRMLLVTLEIRPALITLTAVEKYKLKWWLLSSEQWLFLEQITRVLKAYPCPFANLYLDVFSAI